MSTHPVNLLLRFLLELVALFVAGYWGYNQIMAWPKYLLAVLIPIILAAVWGIFAVPDDPSRSGKTVIKTRGYIRLIIELLFFALAVWFLFNIGFSTIGFTFSVIVLLHYSLSLDRIRWLFAH